MRDSRNPDVCARPNWWVGTGLTTAAVLAMCTMTGMATAGTIDPHNLSGTANLTFADEFTSLSLWDGTSGTWDTNYWYNPLHGNGGSLSTNGEQEWYINSNYGKTDSVVPWHVKNGVLTITGNPAPADIQPLIDGYQYTSGEINSWHSFSQTYGYWEIRCKLPKGQGVWPAFWMLPENGNWPPEIDTFEMLGNDPTTIYVGYHYMKNGVEQNPGTAVSVPDTSKAFHRYGMDWEADYITFYFDGKRVYRGRTPKSMNTPMYMEANLALGGNWGGDVNGTTPFPSNMKIDYIHVYSAKP